MAWGFHLWTTPTDSFGLAYQQGAKHRAGKEGGHKPTETHHKKGTNMKSAIELQCDLTEEILIQPFPVEDLSFRPQSGNGENVRVLTYLTSRDVMARLDLAFGARNWQNDFVNLLENRAIACRLTVKWPDGTITNRTDAGCESEQPDDGDKTKAAFSDALKRAAVLYGIGRYLYDLKTVKGNVQNSRVVEGSVKLPKEASPSCKNLTRRVRVYRLALEYHDKLAQLILPSPAKWFTLPEEEYAATEEKIIALAKS
jgi:hypothetical protein